MTGKFFNVVRAYPTITDIYDRTSISCEFMDMEGYQRWNSLRESNTLQEQLEVFVLTDIDGQSGISEIKSKLIEFDLKYEVLVNLAESTYESSDKTSDDWKTLQSAKVAADQTSNRSFTEWLTSTYTKMNYNETV